MARAAERSSNARALNKEAIARRIRRWTLVLGVAMCVWAWLCYGGLSVPRHMDTVPEIPPGSFCVIDKRRSVPQIGSHVFVELPGVGLVLSRVASRDGDRLTLLHPNTESRVPDSRTLGAIAITTVRGTVLGAFPPGGSGGR